MNCEWKEITLDNFPVIEILCFYLLWFDKNPMNVCFTINDVFFENKDGKNKLNKKDSYEAIKARVVEGYRLYHKIDKKAEYQIDLVKIAEATNG